MSFEAAKCPNCGGAIQVPSERETANCMYCGSVLKVKDAIEKLRIELSGSVAVQSDIEPMLKSADGFLQLQRCEDAKSLYNKIIELNSTDYRAWWGLVRVYTQDFSDFESKIHIDFYKNAEKLADSANSARIHGIYNDYYKKWLPYQELRKKYKATAIDFNVATNTWYIMISPKSRLKAMLLCLVPYAGLHLWYLKRDDWLFYVITIMYIVYGWPISFILIAIGKFKDGDGRPVKNWFESK